MICPGIDRRQQHEHEIDRHVVDRGEVDWLCKLCETLESCAAERVTSALKEAHLRADAEAGAVIDFLCGAKAASAADPP